MAESMEVRANDKIKNLRRMLEQPSLQEQIAKIVPRHLTPERMIRVAVTAIQKTPELLECDQLSIVACIVQAAQLGLEIDPVLGHAYLVPFKNSRTNRREAQLIVGYRGLVALARRSGLVRSVVAEVVREDDEFFIQYGTDRKVHHVPKLNGAKGKNWIGVYAVVEWTDGGKPDFEFMDAQDVAAIRKRSKAADSGPWVTDTEEMWRKTAMRRLSKRLPLSASDNTLVKAAVFDEREPASLAGDASSGIDIESGISLSLPEGTEVTAGLEGTSEEQIREARVRELAKARGMNEAGVLMIIGQNKGRLGELIAELQKSEEKPAEPAGSGEKQEPEPAAAPARARTGSSVSRTELF